MNSLSPVDRAVLNVSVLTWMAKRIKVTLDEGRASLGLLMKKGDTLAARSPLDDSRIARVSMSDPSRTATVSNRAALDGWIRERYPEKLVERTEITGPMPDVLAMLRKHAPELVDDVKSVPDWAVNELLKKAEGLGFPIGYGGECGDDAPPGIAVKTPDGVLTVRLDNPGADVAIRALWDARLVDMDGHIAEIEGGTDGIR